MGLIGWTVTLILVMVLLMGIRIVRPTHRGVIELLGKYQSFRGAGFTWIVPVIQKFTFVNITERLADVEPLDMITKDNLNARVDLQVYYKIKPTEADIKAAMYNVDDVNEQIVQLAQTTARNVIGAMAFKDVNNKRNELNTKLKKILIVETKNWGIDIVRVELREITPPEDVQDTMNRVIKAENLKDAAKDEAEARETEADGIKRAEIKQAEGIAKSKKIVADGEAYRIKTVHEAANEYFKGNAQDLRKYDVTQASLENNAKILLTEKGINPNIILGNIPTEGKGKKS